MGNCLKVGEGETASLVINIRTCLMNVVAKNLSQSCLEKMCGSVVSHNCIASLSVNGGCNAVVLAETAHFHCTEMEILSLCGLFGVGNGKTALTDGDNASVAYLSAALCVERSSVEDNNCIVALGKLGYLCAVLEDSQYLCVYLKLRVIIACKFGL